MNRQLIVVMAAVALLMAATEVDAFARVSVQRKLMERLKQRLMRSETPKVS